MTTLPSLQQLRQAVKLAEKIEELQKELGSIVGKQEAPKLALEKRKRGRPPMSSEAREKIAAAQRKRWAKGKKAGDA